MWEMIIVWAVVILIAIIVELQTADLDSIWFAIGGVIAIILACLNVSIIIQVISFVVSSIILLILCLKFWKKKLKKDFIPTNVNRNIGKIVTVKEVVEKDDNHYVVSMDGQLWSAYTENHTKVNVGEKVEIVAINGNNIIIKKI